MSAESTVEYLFTQNENLEHFMKEYNPQKVEDFLLTHYENVVKPKLNIFKEKLNKNNKNKTKTIK
ncbi:hypothetical protein [Mycoplasma sp. 1654_15]|uniref:hypothetical protein n=1 Tax=Mycoplasma sp. 1654_15 TaxID=2725994 RepID=UPI0014499649|nr:hypothetical protein [Mycoplasma sp. 1654_15]QJB71008.1 hypothetical protein HF996_00540 [Mycoplasma sp. 1654_15]